MLFVLAGIHLTGCNSVKNQYASGLYSVKDVVDGDTFWLNDGTSKGVKIRLIGIDAPESHKSAHKKIGYYGVEAGNYLCRLILGKKVKLEYDIDKTDQYGRTLAYVFLEDGTFVNAELVEKGFARVMTIPPNIRYSADFMRLQRKARRQNKGMWHNQDEMFK